MEGEPAERPLEGADAGSLELRHVVGETCFERIACREEKNAVVAKRRALSEFLDAVIAHALPVVQVDLIEAIADKKEVLAAIDNPMVYLIDAMPEEFYRGEQAMYCRPGHIPGAANVSILKLTDESGRYLPDQELAALFDGNPNARTITYCGGGIAASSTAFALTRVGYSDVAVYTASLQEWAADPDNPMAVDVA